MWELPASPHRYIDDSTVLYEVYSNPRRSTIVLIAIAAVKYELIVSPQNFMVQYSTSDYYPISLN